MACPANTDGDGCSGRIEYFAATRSHLSWIAARIGLVEFHCTDAAADGQPYHWKVAVDVNGDDLAACSGPGGINSACTTALADDDLEGTRPNNIKTRDLPIVRNVQ